MQRKDLIILAAGQDRPGIVDRLSGVVYGEGCNIEDSRMAILRGEFSLIVLVTGAAENLEKLRGKLESLRAELNLTLQLKEPATAEPPGSAARNTLPYELRAVAMDHPGIVHKITHLLSASGVNVARLDTKLSHAPVTGTPVFSLELEAQVPTDLQIAGLRQKLRDLADSENIDLEFHATE